MTLSKKLFLTAVLIITSLACSFTNSLQKSLLLTRVFGSDEVDATSPDVLAEEILEDTLVWNCQAKDLREYLGENWENYPTDLQDLILEVKSSGDTMIYTFSFTHTDDWIIKTDPDYRPPPGATQVPDGVYEIEEKYQAYGTAILDDTLFQGTLRVDYQIITHLPDPQESTGSLEYHTIGGKSRNEEVLEICFDVFGDELANTINHPSLIKQNCRWPGYIFVCTPGP